MKPDDIVAGGAIVDRYEKVVSMYAKQGVTRENVAKTVADGMSANKININPTTGEVFNFGADHKTRLTAAKMGMDMLGDIKTNKDGPNGDVTNIQINIKESNKVEEAVMQYLSEKHGKKKTPEVIIEGDVVE